MYTLTEKTICIDGYILVTFFNIHDLRRKVCNDGHSSFIIKTSKLNDIALASGKHGKGNGLVIRNTVYKTQSTTQILSKTCFTCT
jgi:hypothetical protein